MAGTISLHILRTVVLCLSFIFSCVVLGISAFWIGSSAGLVFFDFQVLLLVTSLLTIILFPALLVVNIIRKNATFTMIICELPIMIVMKVLWLASMILLIQWSNVLFPFKCGALFPNERPTCNQFFALEGLSVVTWLLLLLYTVPLTSLSLLSSRNGNPAWHKTVREAQFSMTTGAAVSIMSNGLHTVNRMEQQQQQQQQQQTDSQNNLLGAASGLSTGQGAGTPASGYFRSQNQSQNQMAQYTPSTTATGTPVQSLAAQYPPQQVQMQQAYPMNVPQV